MIAAPLLTRRTGAAAARGRAVEQCSVAGHDERDATELDRLLAERLDLRAQLGLAVGRAGAATWELDVRRDRFTWAPQAAEVLGVTPARVPASALELAAAVHPEDSAAALAALEALLDAGFAEAALRVGREAGLRHLSLRGMVQDRDRRGRPLRAVGLVLDVTTEKAMEEQLLRMVKSDALTGVPNRRAFDQQLRGDWRRCTRAREPISIILMDLDNFKRFNDTFGHLVGDDALCSVARALTATLARDGAVVARFGGEEFAVVLPGTDSSDALTVGSRLVEAVRAVTVQQAADWRLTASVGTASRHPDSATVRSAELLARAEKALHAAKAAGKDRAVAYEHFLAARATIEAAIAHGLAENEFKLYYQPVIALATGDVAGFEALVRWDRPGQGLVAPDSFIPAAEASTLICDLGRWALREAACQLATWSREGLDPGGELRVAVNASGRHVGSPAIVADVEAALAAAGIAPGRLELELTETTLVEHALADTHLASVRALGVKVALDDFGTGYTSIGQLPHLPVDTLKIDRSFIISADPRQRGLVTLIIEAGHTFGLRVVAEGIEDAETLQILRDLGCDAAQGYLMGRPMPAGLVASWLADWRAATLAALPAGH